MSDVRRLMKQGYEARRDKRLTDAERDFTEAVEEARRSHDRDLLAQALKGLGQIERDQGRTESARERYEEAAAIYVALNDPLALAHTIRHVADIHRVQGNPQLAEPCYDEALGLYRANAATPPLDLANAIRGLALLKNDKALWAEARDLYASLDVQAGVDECSRWLST